MPRSIVGLFAILLSASLLAGEVHRVAPPGRGPIFSSSSVSAAFGPEGGIAVWRVGPNAIWGVPLDPEGRQRALAREILFEEPTVGSPSISFLDGSFLLWWSTGFPREARYARLDANGNVLSRGTAQKQTSGPLASNGILLITYAGETLEFLDRDLVPVRSVTLPESDLIRGIGVAVLEDGTFAVMIWGWDGIFVQWVSAIGEPVGERVLIEASRGTTAAAYRPLGGTIASDGSSVLIVWIAGTYTTQQDLKRAVARSDGSVTQPEKIAGGRFTDFGYINGDFSDGMYTVIVSAEEPGAEIGISAVRLDRDGNVVAPGLSPVVDRAGDQIILTSVPARGRHLLLFRDRGRDEIFAVGVSASGALARSDLSAVDGVVNVGPAAQTSARAAAGGDEWLAVWVERTGNSEEIRTAPLRRDGSPAAPPSTLTSIFRYIGTPDVAFNGIDFVVGWLEGPAMLAKRIRRDGTVIDAAPIVVSPAASGRSAIASNQGTVLLVWLGEGAVHAAVLHPGGSVSESRMISPPAERSTGASGTPFVAADADGFVVAWTEVKMHPCVGPPCSTTARVLLQRVDTDGIPAGGAVSVDQRETLTSLAAAGESYILTFSGHAGSLARIVDSRTGALSPPIVLSTTAHPQIRALSEGERFLVAYSSQYGPVLRRISPLGTLTPPVTYDSFTAPGAINASGELLAIGTQRVADPPHLGAPAVLAQIIDRFTPVPPVRRRSAGR